MTEIGAHTHTRSEVSPGKLQVIKTNLGGEFLETKHVKLREESEKVPMEILLENEDPQGI